LAVGFVLFPLLSFPRPGGGAGAGAGGGAGGGALVPGLVMVIRGLMAAMVLVLKERDEKSVGQRVAGLS
jgi:hypothetical protein